MLPVVILMLLLTHAGGCFLQLQGVSPVPQLPGVQHGYNGMSSLPLLAGLMGSTQGVPAGVEGWVWSSGWILTPTAASSLRGWCSCSGPGGAGPSICITADGSDLSLGTKSCSWVGGKDFWKPPVKRARSESISPSFHVSANIPHPTADQHRKDSPKGICGGVFPLCFPVPKACERLLGSEHPDPAKGAGLAVTPVGNPTGNSPLLPPVMFWGAAASWAGSHRLQSQSILSFPSSSKGRSNGGFVNPDQSPAHRGHPSPSCPPTVPGEDPQQQTPWQSGLVLRASPAPLSTAWSFRLPSEPPNHGRKRN